MLRKTDFIIDGSSDNKILIDIVYQQNRKLKNVVIFSHGFKGFKDWGAFNKIAEYFALNNVFFIKFNFSHNGTTIDNPHDFKDLSSFGSNNYCIELEDLNCVINWLISHDKLKKEIDISNISLLGHSRGGAISILKASSDNRISNVISWAAPSNLLNKFPKGDKLKKWKETNVAYVYNGRTKQNMPIYYQFYLNSIQNHNKLNIKDRIKDIKCPILIIHGSIDPTVSVSDAYNLASWNKNAELHIVDESDHVFGATHPFNLEYLPIHLKEVIDVTIKFLKI